MRCRNCLCKNFFKIINIGKQPLSGIFYNKKKKRLPKYSLDLYQCKNCRLIQLSKDIPVEQMYGNKYGYQTSISRLMTNHLRKKFDYLKNNKLIKKKSNILDIGSNDGTFLNFFNKSYNLYGVDPSGTKYKRYYRKDIILIPNFFSKEKLDQYFYKTKKKIEFDLITSFAIFYDVSDPNKFCNDIYHLLKEDGIWISEFSYFPLMLKNLTYDQICHEHITYYTCQVFKDIIENNNLKIIDLNLNEINGGSIEIICAKKSSKRLVKKYKIDSILRDEKNINLKSYKNFNNRIIKIKKNFLSFFKKNNKSLIIGYGASTKGNIIINHCNITSKNIKFICDSNKNKYNLFTPGKNIKIISKQTMRKLNPEYLIVFIWSFRKEVISEEIKFIKNGGKLVFHLPKFHIVDKNNYKIYLKKKFSELSYNY
jgi:NDP-4-keto-2,6-dideoxyhexose 3-C-methyltransferase